MFRKPSTNQNHNASNSNSFHWRRGIIFRTRNTHIYVSICVSVCVGIFLGIACIFSQLSFLFFIWVVHGIIGQQNWLNKLEAQIHLTEMENIPADKVSFSIRCVCVCVLCTCAIQCSSMTYFSIYCNNAGKQFK